MKAHKTKELVLTALLIAIGIIIPVYFGFLRVILPPAFTATLMSHVPIFIAMFISPWSALFTALGTTLGFAFAGLSPVVTARAASHIIFALIGAYMIKKRCSLANTGIVVTIILDVLSSNCFCNILVLLFPFAAPFSNLSYSFIV